MGNLDINKVLQDTLQAIQPVALERAIDLSFTNANQSFYVGVPLDEVLGPVMWFLLRLLYIAPKGHNISVGTLKRDDPETGKIFLRIEIKTKGLHCNPNLLFRPDNNRFKIESSESNHSVVFIEWILDTVTIPVNPPDVVQNSLGIEITRESNKAGLNTEHLYQTVLRRFEDLGNSTFVQEKLKSTRSRKDAEFLEHAVNTIYKNLDDADFDSEALGQQLCLSRAQLFRKLKGLTGFSAANFIRRLRLQRAAELLETTGMSIGDISIAVGFNELSYFSSSFFETFQVSPTTWRKTTKNETIV